ncbi:MAG: winged helix-turn-helix transcriptional regulator [Candidatus Micrarchaeaceae archaeon]
MAEDHLSSEFNSRYSIPARKMIRMVSENSRIKITEMAKKLDMSRRTVAVKLANLEKELGIRYTIEFDEEKLELNRQHLIMVKFGSKPDYGKITETLGRSYIPQIAVEVKGTYDMLVYANAMSGTEYARWDRAMQMLLSPYKPTWQASEVVHRQLGFFPLRNEIIDMTRVSPKYKRMLKILNGNSRISFQELARNLNMNVNTAVYNFNKLVSLGYIKSFTATMDMPKDMSLMTFFSRYTPSDGYEGASSKARALFMSDDPEPLVSRYLLTAPLIGGYDFFTLGAFDNHETAYKEDVLCHKHIFRKYNIRILYGDVRRILLGRIPIRSVDTKANYKTIVWSTDSI